MYMKNTYPGDLFITQDGDDVLNGHVKILQKRLNKICTPRRNKNGH